MWLPVGGNRTINSCLRKLARCIVLVRINLPALVEVAWLRVLFPVHLILDVDGLANADVVNRCWCVVARLSNPDRHWTVGILVCQEVDIVGGESCKGGVRIVDKGLDTCPAIVDISNVDVLDLRWERWFNVHSWLISAKA